MKATLLGAALALTTLTGGALAGTPYDFAGHWTGNVQQTGKSAVTLTTDFTMAGARSFSGTLAMPGDDGQPVRCTVNGKARRRSNVSMRADSSCRWQPAWRCGPKNRSYTISEEWLISSWDNTLWPVATSRVPWHGTRTTKRAIFTADAC